MKYTLLILLMVSGICQGQIVIWKADSTMLNSTLREGSNIYYLFDREARVKNMSELIEQLAYSELLQEAGWPISEFAFRVLVDKKGKTLAIIRVKPSKNWGAMDEIFIDVLIQAKWKPAISNGKATDSWVTLPFHLDPLKE